MILTYAMPGARHLYVGWGEFLGSNQAQLITMQSWDIQTRAGPLEVGCTLVLFILPNIPCVWRTKERLGYP